METFTDDTVVTLASFLAPHDLLSLALTCKRFGARHGMNKKRSAARGENTREVRQRIETTSLMEVAAQTVLQTKWSDEEKTALPRRGEESWIGLYQEFLKLFRLPLRFDKLVGDNIDYVDNADRTTIHNPNCDVYSSAICSNIMRAGKHSVSFQVDNNPYQSLGIMCGVMRPTTNDIPYLPTCCPIMDDLSSFSLKDYGRLHSGNIDSCVLSTIIGMKSVCRRWTDNEPNIDGDGWEGMEWIREASFKIGFVLDLDEGTLDVYKNDRRLGTMKSGLVGEYCWVVPLKSSGPQIMVSISR